jgi:hypothetical protein
LPTSMGQIKVAAERHYLLVPASEIRFIQVSDEGTNRKAFFGANCWHVNKLSLVLGVV